MTAKIFYNPIQFSAIGGHGGSHPTGYRSENLENARLAKPYRGDPTVAQTIELDTGSVQSIGAVFLPSINCELTALRVSADDSANPTNWTTAGSSLTPVLDPPGHRRKLWLAIGGSWRHVALDIPAQTPLSGTQLEIGAVWLFGATWTMPRNFTLGVGRREVVPHQAVTLPNGRLARVTLGPSYATLDLRAHDLPDESAVMSGAWNIFMQSAAGLVIGYYSHDFWVMSCDETDYSAEWSDSRVVTTNLKLREIV